MNRSSGRLKALGFFLLFPLCVVSQLDAEKVDAVSGEELQIEIVRKGSSVHAMISQGAKEWFMLIDVTPEHTVVVRQEKDHDRCLVDESETHDRPMTSGEVDAAIADYVESVKTRVKK